MELVNTLEGEVFGGLDARSDEGAPHVEPILDMGSSRDSAKGFEGC